MKIKEFLKNEPGRSVVKLILTGTAILGIAYVYDIKTRNNYEDTNSYDVAEVDTTTASNPEYSDEISEPSAYSIFAEFKSNKVAFDRNHKNQMIEVEGEITEISTFFGCSNVSIKGGNSAFDEIKCTNCPSGKDKWLDEVASLAVGQTVKIKGYYSAVSSESYYMSLNKCHVVN